MTPDTLIDRIMFVDGTARPVFVDPRSGARYITDLDGRTEVYGVWLRDARGDETGD